MFRSRLPARPWPLAVHPGSGTRQADEFVVCTAYEASMKVSAILQDLQVVQLQPVAASEWGECQAVNEP